MGLFKGMKDLAGVTKQAKEMQDKQQADQGFKPGIAGQFQQMGSMLEQANEQLSELNDANESKDGLLATGIKGEGVIVAHGTPARGASWFNLDIDMEIHIPGRQAYRVNNQYMVPASATLGPGVNLPVKVDANDPAKIAIDWNAAPKPAAAGEVRPVGGDGFAPAPAAAASAGGGDPVAELERLAKLRDSGALSDAEFEQQKARVLGS